ncbi:MAG: translation initiation factor [Pseudoflavonifractor sp.]|nr:translation initiation factor [Pseudoflavonifractor sp.]
MDWKSALSSIAATVPEAGAEPDVTPDAELSSGHTGSKSAVPVIDIYYERKGRGGKQATIIAGFECSDDDLVRLAATIKKRLGTGGSARGGEILVQGDRRADLARLLPGLGYPKIKMHN